jgi:multidrug resistance efflux pump
MFRVVAPVRVVGAGQQVIAAPVDGFVQSVLLRPGQPVKAGEVLVTLQDRELQLERDKLGAEITQLDNLYRDALTRDDAAQIVIARSKREQVQAQLDLVLSHIERTQLRSPINGVLIAGDLSQALGMPVKRGQELLTVAPDTAYRIVAEVDEQDVAPLREGQRGRVLFGAFAQRNVQMLVTRIAPVASVVDGRNVFEVDGSVELDADAAAGELLRPGLRGVVRIDVEERALGATWWQRARHGLQRAWWRIQG